MIHISITLETVMKTLPTVLNFVMQCEQNSPLRILRTIYFHKKEACSKSIPKFLHYFAYTLITVSIASNFHWWYVDDGPTGGNTPVVLEERDKIISLYVTIGFRINSRNVKFYARN